MKKGFTLIELLAVIVILAIIALIAVPIVLGIINDAKRSSMEESVKMYANAIEDGVANYLLKHPGEAIELELEDIKEYINYSGEKIECETVQIGKKGDVYLTGCTVGSTKIDYEYGTPFTSRKKDYRGYYADVDGDGTPDGVIYADLQEGRSGDFYNEQITNQTNGAYSYEMKTNLKEYIISKNKYKGKFGEKEIISLRKGSSGNSRFYVMALKDFTTEAYTDPNDSNNNYPAYTAYYWYKNAKGKMNSIDTSEDFGTGYTNTGKIIKIWNKNGEGAGSYTGATQDSQDIFKHIQKEYAKGWYIPSLGEWTAFADYFEITSDYNTGEYVENSGNYNTTYGFFIWYASSSQSSENSTWHMNFSDGTMHDGNVDRVIYVRLGITF